MEIGSKVKLNRDIIDLVTGDHPDLFCGNKGDIVTIIALGCVDSCYPVKVSHDTYGDIFYVDYSEIEEI